MAPGITPDSVRDLGLERAVAVAQQHGQNRCISLYHIYDGQIGAAVTGEVARNDGLGVSTRPRR